MGLEIWKPNHLKLDKNVWISNGLVFEWLGPKLLLKL